jgi:RNA-directed DNA polymerase
MTYDNHYKSKIVTVGSKNRVLDVPDYFLKTLQRSCQSDILNLAMPISDICHSYRKHLSVDTALAVHCVEPSQAVLTFDLTDFFHSLKSDRLYLLFVKHGMEKQTAKGITALNTYKSGLPKGGINSPYLSNCMMYELDQRIKFLMAQRCVRVTRYADDYQLSVGSNLPNVDGLPILSKALADIELLLNDSGLLVNNDKTKLNPVWMLGKRVFYCKGY